MPSSRKKKAKAPKTRQAAPTAVKYGSASCPHRDLTKDWAPDEYAACEELLSKMKTRLSAVFEEAIVEMVNDSGDMLSLTQVAVKVSNLYESERRNETFSNQREQILREMVLAEGTEIVRSAANETDLTKEESIYEALPFLFLLVTVEVSEKHKWWHGYEDYLHEIVTLLDDIINCPRNIVRFFHRRNDCDCLKLIYYKLKDETERTALCCRPECDVVKGVKGMIQCQHCSYRWCSKSCCKAMQTSHERYCKSIKEAEIKEEGKALKRLLKVVAIFYVTLAAMICFLRFHGRMRIFDLKPFVSLSDDHVGAYLFDWCDGDCIAAWDKFFGAHDNGHELKFEQQARRNLQEEVERGFKKLLKQSHPINGIGTFRG